MLAAAFAIVLLPQLAAASVYATRPHLAAALRWTSAAAAVLSAFAALVMLPAVADPDLDACATFAESTVRLLALGHIAALGAAAGCAVWVIRRLPSRRPVGSVVFGEICAIGLAVMILLLASGGSTC